MSASGQSEQEPAVAQMIEVNGQSGEHDRVSIGCASDVRAKPKRLVLAGEPPHAASNHVNVGWSGNSTASKPSSSANRPDSSKWRLGLVGVSVVASSSAVIAADAVSELCDCVVRRYGRRCTPAGWAIQVPVRGMTRATRVLDPGASTRKMAVPSPTQAAWPLAAKRPACVRWSTGATTI